MGMCYIVKNLVKFLKELCLALNEIWDIIMKMTTGRGNVCTLTVVVRY